MKKKIISVGNDSPASKLGIEQGDYVLSINDITDFDIIDYMYYTADDTFKIEIENAKGEIKTIIASNPDGLPFGIAFENITVDIPRFCANKCIFCFMDQMPDGMRSSLYFKDDDYRLSFLCGNYITLTNLSDEDLNRIIKYKLSPLCISVHATDPQKRTFLTGNRFAGDIMEKLYKLKDGGIRFNLQFVLCPGINDGETLKQSLEAALGLFTAVESLSCVPVGLTKFREGLYPLRLYTKVEAEGVLDIIEDYRKKVKAYGSDVPFCASDEFYVIAGRKVPDSKFYSGYPQYENGVGMIRSFIDGIDDFLAEEKNSLNGLTATLVTGTSAFDVITENINKINNITGSTLSVECIENNFFGDTVSVAGLVCGCDIINQLKKKIKDNMLIIPENMLKEDEDVFLDDITIKQIEAELNVKVLVVPHDGYEFLNALKEFAYE